MRARARDRSRADANDSRSNLHRMQSPRVITNESRRHGACCTGADAKRRVKLIPSTRLDQHAQVRCAPFGTTGNSQHVHRAEEPQRKAPSQPRSNDRDV